MYFFLILFESLNTSFKKCKVIIMAWLKTSRRNDVSNFAGFKLCECILNLANLPLNLWSIPDKSAKFYVLCKIYHTWSFIALLSDFLHKNCSDGQNVNIFLWDALSEIHYLKATILNHLSILFFPLNFFHPNLTWRTKKKQVQKDHKVKECNVSFFVMN